MFEWVASTVIAQESHSVMESPACCVYMFKFLADNLFKFLGDWVSHGGCGKTVDSLDEGLFVKFCRFGDFLLGSSENFGDSVRVGAVDAKCLKNAEKAIKGINIFGVFDSFEDGGMHLNEAFVNLFPDFSVCWVQNHILVSHMITIINLIQIFFFRVSDVVSEVIIEKVIIMDISSSVFSVLTKICKNIP